VVEEAGLQSRLFQVQMQLPRGPEVVEEQILLAVHRLMEAQVEIPREEMAKPAVVPVQVLVVLRGHPVLRALVAQEAPATVLPVHPHTQAVMAAMAVLTAAAAAAAVTNLAAVVVVAQAVLMLEEEEEEHLTLGLLPVLLTQQPGQPEIAQLQFFREAPVPQVMLQGLEWEPERQQAVPMVVMDT
jgi:hypothetical protein